MAEVGAKIDFSKKYKMKDGTKIARIERSGNDVTYPIIAYTEKGTFFGYTEDGLWAGKGESEFNLVLDEEQPKNEWKHNKSIRLPDHFHIVERKCADDILIAVSEDNKIYWIVPANNIDGNWERLPDLPQD